MIIVVKWLLSICLQAPNRIQSTVDFMSLVSCLLNYNSIIEVLN